MLEMVRQEVAQQAAAAAGWVVAARVVALKVEESMVEGESAVQGYAVAKTAGELRVAGFREAFEGERLAQEPPAGVPQETE